MEVGKILKSQKTKFMKNLNVRKFFSNTEGGKEEEFFVGWA